MKKKSFLMLCIIMVLAVCMLALAGCGGGGDDMQTGYIYLPEYISLPDEIEYMERAFYHDGTMSDTGPYMMERSRKSYVAGAWMYVMSSVCMRP